MHNCSNCNERQLDCDCPNRPPPEPLRAPATAAGAGTADPPKARAPRPAAVVPRATAPDLPTAAAAQPPPVPVPANDTPAPALTTRRFAPARAPAPALSALRFGIEPTENGWTSPHEMGGADAASDFWAPRASYSRPALSARRRPPLYPAQPTLCSPKETSPNPHTLRRPPLSLPSARSAALWRPSPCVSSACSFPPRPPWSLGQVRTRHHRSATACPPVPRWALPTAHRLRRPPPAALVPPQRSPRQRQKSSRLFPFRPTTTLQPLTAARRPRHPPFHPQPHPPRHLPSAYALRYCHRPRHRRPPGASARPRPPRHRPFAHPLRHHRRLRHHLPPGASAQSNRATSPPTSTSAPTPWLSAAAGATSYCTPRSNKRPFAPLPNARDRSTLTSKPP